MNTLRRLIIRAGRRGAFLSFLTILDIAYGFSLYHSKPSVRVIDLFLPWEVWGIVWLVVGAVCAAGIFTVHDRFSFVIAAMLKTCWALLFVDVWLAQHFPDGWVSVVVWLAFAAVVLIVSGWTEPAKRAEVPNP